MKKLIPSQLFAYIFVRRGFTLIELMIVVVLLGVLAAVAIPSYLGYLRRGYVNEAVTGIAGVKAAEEQYFSVNPCYTEADPSPAAIPSGTSVAWPTGAALPNGWGQAALSVRPDATVRFQYRVYATNRWAATDSCDDPADDPGDVNAALVALGPGSGACVASGVGTGSTSLVNTSVFPNHWYVVVAEGDLDSDPDTNTILISVVDDSRIIRCFETF